jgi:hypothetical protein
MNVPKMMSGKVVLQCFMLDNSYKTLLIEPTATVLVSAPAGSTSRAVSARSSPFSHPAPRSQEVCRVMAEKIGFSDPEEDSLCFGLSECTDGVTSEFPPVPARGNGPLAPLTPSPPPSRPRAVQRALMADREILNVMEGWFEKPSAKFIFQLKLYSESLVTSKDPKVIHMMFIQAVYNVISGTYPTSDKEAVNLAALQFQTKFGPHNSASHKPGFLKNLIQEFLPASHLGARPGVPAVPVEQWEKLIFHKHAFSTSTTPREAYLEVLKKREYYGAVLFAVKQRFDRKMPKRVIMAVGRQGVLLLRIPESYTQPDMDVLGRYGLADIYRWAYKTGSNFYFEIKLDGAETNPVYTFDTPEGKHMSDMLTDYAMALLREMGLNPDGTRRVRGRPGEAPAAAAAELAAAPAVDASPTKASMAASADSYEGVGGQAGSLASAATRSGEYGSAEGGAGAGLPPPPPPPADAGEPEAPGPADAAFDKPLPPDWIRVLDEASAGHYFFNTSTGDSVWDYEEVTKA